MSTATVPSGTTKAAGKQSPSSTGGTSLKIDAYLFFDGRCDEAIEFYRRTLGAEVQMLMRFNEAPDQQGCGPMDGKKVMHASLRIGESTVMASDGRCEGKLNFQGFALSITVPNEAEATRRFNALAEGGSVMQPLSQTFFAKSFGMVTDRFGVMWMVIALP